ncbi:hypothetical protein EG329_010423 [Mollisiaceae sp. DMI_Dod_QoI]|nr:hypothetical protein EG329_010423 [Helotiales sp. DMI_Dod_QoI]
MSEPRRNTTRMPLKVPNLAGDLATPKAKQAGRPIVTIDGSPLPKQARSVYLSSSANTALRSSNPTTFGTPRMEGTPVSKPPPKMDGTPSTPKSRMSGSGSVSLASRPSGKRTNTQRDITSSDEERQPPRRGSVEAGCGGVLVVRANKDKTPQHIVVRAWNQEFAFDPKQSNPNVALDKVEVKLEIAQHFIGDLDNVNNKTKRDLLLEYLAAKHAGRPIKPITEQSTGSEIPRDIRVGTHRRHGIDVNVYAFLNNGSVQFHIHEDENKHLLLPKKAVDYDDIAFSLAYQYDSPTENKQYIKDMLRESPEPMGTFSSGTIPERRVILGQVEDDELSRALWNFKNAGPSLVAEFGKRERALQEWSGELTREKEKIILREEYLNKRDNVLREKEHRLEEQERRLREATFERDNQDTSGLGSAANSKLSEKLAAHKNPVGLRLDRNTTFVTSFDKIPAGKPNAGMYLEKMPINVNGRGPYEKLKFQRFRILQSPTIEVDGDLVQEGFEYSGYKYSLYKKDGQIKMVQDFEPGGGTILYDLRTPAPFLGGYCPEENWSFEN